MWKQLEDFDRAEEAEREVVESIVEKTVNKHRLDAGEISVKVPDMLLRECQDEIRRVRSVSCWGFLIVFAQVHFGLLVRMCV